MNFYKFLVLAVGLFFGQFSLQLKADESERAPTQMKDMLLKIIDESGTPIAGVSMSENFVFVDSKTKFSLLKEYGHAAVMILPNFYEEKEYKKCSFSIPLCHI